MRTRALADLVRRDLRRGARMFALAGIGIAVGIATLSFFVALGNGMRDIVLGRVFPIDRVEVAPPESSAGSSLLAMLEHRVSGLDAATIAQLRAMPGVRAVFPKMRLSFPSSGRGGRALFGRDIGTGEIVADGIDPALVAGDLAAGVDFNDPLPRASNRACASDADCADPELCDVALDPGGRAMFPGQCAPPIPALVSPYLVEVFNGAVAPAHNLPRIGALLLRQTDGLVLEWDLGRAVLGMARQGQQRRVHAQIVGMSARAIDLGFTVPLAVARRFNREYAGEEAGALFTSAVVQLRHPSDTNAVTARVRSLGLDVKTSGAEQMGLLVAIITAVLSLTSVIVVVIAALNIAHVFYTAIAERRGEIGLMRALGATRGDVRSMVIAQAAVLGLFASLIGAGLARLAALGWNRVAATQLPPFPFKPDDWFVFDLKSTGLVLAFGIGACVLSAIAPATRAAKIEPAEALAANL